MYKPGGHRPPGRSPGFNQPGDAPHRDHLYGPVRAEQVGPTLRRLWAYLAAHRRPMLTATGLVLLTSLLGVLNPYFISLAIDRGIVPRDYTLLFKVVIAMVALAGLTAYGNWLQTTAMLRISQQVVQRLRDEVFAALQRLPLRTLEGGHARGDLMSRLTNDVELVNGALAESVTQFLSGVLRLMGVISMMMALNVRLGLLTLLTVPLYLLLTRAIATRTRRGFRDRQRVLGDLSASIEEVISAQPVVVACHRQAEVIAEFIPKNDALRRAAFGAQVLVGSMGPLMNLLQNLSFTVVAGLGGLLTLHGLATVGTVAAFVQYARQLSMPLNQLAGLFGLIQSAIASAERVFELLDWEREPDPPANIQLSPKGALCFEDVHFSYVPDSPVLMGLTFSLKPGQTVVLMGPTGAGKTTIIGLLARFYEPDSGTIRLDGIPLPDLNRDALRRAFGMVPQDNVLFSATVRENLRYGRLDATDEAIERAAHLTGADDFIRKLPQGYDTPLTPEGGTLSQGQRQLLSLARALLADPALLILDEATSSVDPRTEAQLQMAMKTLMTGRTCLIIAHRLSTARLADQILVIEEGRITEQGPPDVLRQGDGFYAKACRLSAALSTSA